MVYIAPDDSPSAGETIDPREELTPGEQLANNIGGGGGDDDDDHVPFSDRDDDGSSTGGYGSIDHPNAPDPGNSESGMPGGGDPAGDVISPDPNENTDGDEVTINPDGSASIDPDRVSGGYDSVDEIAEQVEATLGGGSNSPQVAEITALEEQIRNLRERLSGMGQVTSGSSPSSPSLTPSSSRTAAVVAVVVAAVVAAVAAVSGGDSSA
ncbi:hypothetical protein C440_07527 [Haloferax mucosum ATCC BAA-1512]|uniref:Uncharacterized protein n=1 Tax=Haloferax mucosum ATCC BAA-1512 TaxID=662479 RepID=M0IGD1_9EURY|nr:hypothetical protein [Haloferax mucosum]ELZ94908.1 hypothetical protein C440_07527 [Haloferax mucosum ATCC BAA-1512]